MTDSFRKFINQQNEYNVELSEESKLFLTALPQPVIVFLNPAFKLIKKITEDKDLVDFADLSIRFCEDPEFIEINISDKLLRIMRSEPYFNKELQTKYTEKDEFIVSLKIEKSLVTITEKDVKENALEESLVDLVNRYALDMPEINCAVLGCVYSFSITAEQQGFTPTFHAKDDSDIITIQFIKPGIDAALGTMRFTLNSFYATKILTDEYLKSQN